FTRPGHNQVRRLTMNSFWERAEYAFCCCVVVITLAFLAVLVSAQGSKAQGNEVRKPDTTKVEDAKESAEKARNSGAETSESESNRVLNTMTLALLVFIAGRI